MTAALKIVFALYTLYSTFFAFRNAVPYVTPTLLLWAFLSLCLLPVAWGVIRERKWAWNCALGLVIVRFCFVIVQIASLFMSTVLNPPVLNGILLRAFALSLTLPVIVFIMLILSRASFRSTAAADETNPPSYFRPVFVGVIFLVMGLLTFMHPISLHESPALLRMLGFIFVAFLWTSAALCFFEHPWKRIRSLATIATAIAALGAIASLSFYAYFALLGMVVGILQLLLGATAVFTAKNSFTTLPKVAIA